MNVCQTAHHIVPIGDENNRTIRLREILNEFGIDITSVANSVGLTRHSQRRHQCIS
jgi:hypothetical protein